MGEFYESKGIQLMERDDNDDFMRLLKNLRGGITQIMKRPAKVDIKTQARSNPPSTTWTPTTCMEEPCIVWMPYELVGIPERREAMEKTNCDPNGWVPSLKTFGKYGFFIE